MSSSPALPGYENLELIGKGGFSRVYSADQTKLKRKVAVKVLNFGLTDDAEKQSFARETELMGRVSTHPNIVTVHDTAFTSEGQPCIVMELYPGGSLADLINQVGRLRTKEVLEVGVAIASALEASHQSGVLHCDLKPQNVLISKFGQPALGDFGISTFAEEHTRTGSDAGAGFTLPYAAPEIVEGESPTVSSDVYSLSATLYTSLCGRRPFAYPTPENSKPAAAEHARRILLEPVPSLIEREVAPEVDAVIRHAMAKDPADRPATAAEFAMLLHQVGQRLGLATSMPRIADQASLRTVDADNVGSGQIDLTQLVNDQYSLDHTASGSGFAHPREIVASESRRRVAPVIGVLAVVLAGVMLFVLSRGGSEPVAEPSVLTTAATTTNTTSVAPLQVADPVLAPTQPSDVRLERVPGNEMIVTWQAPAAEIESGDVRYEVRRQDDSTESEPLVVLGASARLTAIADDEAVCVTVMALRSTRASAPSQPTCSAPLSLDIAVSPTNCWAPCEASVILVEGDPDATYQVAVFDRSLDDVSEFVVVDPTLSAGSPNATMTVAADTPAGDYLVSVTYPDGSTQRSLFTVDPAP